MKYFILIIVLLFLCLSSNAQEKFNKVLFDTTANISSSIIVIDTGYIALSGSYVNNGIGFLIKFFDNEGNLETREGYRLEGYDCYEGWSNSLYKDNDMFYTCGSAINLNTSEENPFIVLFNSEMDTILFDVIQVEEMKNSYDIVKINDSIYGLVGQEIIGDDIKASLLLYNINNPANLHISSYGIVGNTSTEAASEIIKTFSNNLLLGGMTFGFSTATYKQDWYLVKTDLSGNMIWERNFGNYFINDGTVQKLVQTKDSCFIAVGGHGITNWSGDPILEGCLRKIDTSGNLVYEKLFRRYGYDTSDEVMRYCSSYISDIVELENTNLAFIVSFNRADGGILTMLISTDSIGNILNIKQIYTMDALGSNFCTSIKQTSDQGFIIYGYGDFMFTYDPPQQLFLIKTDSLFCEGELYPAPPVENVECPDFPDTMYCHGTYNSRLRVQGKSAPYTLEFSTGEIVENLYYPPVFIPKSQGTGSFTVHVGIDTYNHSYDTATLYNPIPAEDMEPDIIELPFSLTIPENYFGPDLTVTITNGYGESYEITLPVYVDCNVSAEQTTEKANINIYPNPSSDFLQISLPQFDQNSFVKIINAQGQVVLVEQLFNAETKLNISELVAGNYVVRFYCGNKIENLRFDKM
jgi:hypothetical protein